jgi:pyruvate,orthophosphate dikinase
VLKAITFEELIENYKLTKGVLLDTDLDENDWDGLIVDFKRTVKEKAKKDFPKMFISNYWEQLVQYFCLGKVIEQKFIEN